MDSVQLEIGASNEQIDDCEWLDVKVGEII